MSLFNRQVFTAIPIFLLVMKLIFNGLLTLLSLGSLLLRRECCTFSNGEYVKSGLAELEKWIVNTGDEASKISMLQEFFILVVYTFLF